MKKMKKLLIAFVRSPEILFFYAKPLLKNLSNSITVYYLAQTLNNRFSFSKTNLPLGGKPEG